MPSSTVSFSMGGLMPLGDRLVNEYSPGSLSLPWSGLVGDLVMPGRHTCGTICADHPATPHDQ